MTTNSATTRVALYARISEDRHEGAGVADQLRRGRDYAAAHGWEVVTELQDNDISAFTGKHRPGYAELVRLVRERRIDGVVVYQSSRLLRDRAERAEAIDVFGKAHVSIYGTQGPSYDLTTAYGRGVFAMLGEVDTMESDVKAERVTAACERRALAGTPNGGLGYGWRKAGDGYVIDPAEGAIVREIVDRLNSGESLRGITDDLNARKVPAPNSDTWGKTSVKKIAIRPSNVSKRVHHKGRPDETTYDGRWPAIVTDTKHAKVVGMLTDPARRANHERPGARVHLLSWGIGTCGVCGSRLRVALKGNSRYGTKQRLYVCDDKGCVGRNETSVDALVADVVIGRLSMPDALDWLMGDDEAAKVAAERAADLRARLNAAADDCADGLIDREQLNRITARLRPQLDAAEDERRRHMVTADLDTLAALAGPKARARWDSMTVTQKRLVVDVLFDEVVIDRVTRRGAGFDPESVRFLLAGAG